MKTLHPFTQEHLKDGVLDLTELDMPQKMFDQVLKDLPNAGIRVFKGDHMKVNGDWIKWNHHKNVTRLIDGLLALPALEEISFENYLGDAQIERLVKGLNGSTLKRLNVAHNDLWKMQPFADALPNSQLEALDLGENNLAREMHLFRLPLYRTLKSLSLRENEVATFGLSRLAGDLDVSMLEELNLSKTGMEKHSADTLANYLRGSKLTSLNLSNNRELGGDGLKPIAEKLAKTSIETLDVSNCGLGYTGSVALGEHLANSKLKILKLDHNNMNMKELCKGVSESPLEELYLRSCEIDRRDIEYLANAIAQPDCKLTMLNIEHNQPLYDSLDVLVEALPKSKLKTLVLSKIQPKDGYSYKNLADKLPQTKIENLYLSGMLILSENLPQLADGLPNSHLHHLDLHDNWIHAGPNDKNMLAFIEALSQSDVTSIDLSENEIDPSLLKDVDAVIAANRARLAQMPVTADGQAAPTVQVSEPETVGTVIDAPAKPKEPKQPKPLTEKQKIAAHVEAIKKENSTPGFGGF